MNPAVIFLEDAVHCTKVFIISMLFTCLFSSEKVIPNMQRSSQLPPNSVLYLEFSHMNLKGMPANYISLSLFVHAINMLKFEIIVSVMIVRYFL